jgi:hypothetical protein
MEFFLSGFPTSRHVVGVEHTGILRETSVKKEPPFKAPFFIRVRNILESKRGGEIFLDEKKDPLESLSPRLAQL